MPYFDDDGNELNPDLVVKPALCQVCRNIDNPAMEILCTLSWLDYTDNQDEEFDCGDYAPIS